MTDVINIDALVLFRGERHNTEGRVVTIQKRTLISETCMS